MFSHAFTCRVSSDSTILATTDYNYDYDEGYVHLIDVSTW